MSFKVIKTHVPEDTWDARQRLVSGWDADAIRRATVLVIGAGAIGNETLKNLALLGFGHAIVCDLDKIELSNLTRTVLFTQQDVGKEKAPLAAERFLEMNLEPTATADSFSGDIVYGLGDGVFRRADVVLGCLDNVETRMYVNKICMRYDIPYIDAGIGSLGCTLQIMGGHNYGCYACHAPGYKYEDRFRQSCAVSMKKAAASGKAATVQCTSAIVSGMQVQEALKIVCGMNTEYGVELHFQGTANLFSKFGMGIDENCICHMIDAREDIVETPLSCSNTLRELLEYARTLGLSTMYVLDDKLRGFLPEVPCPICGKPVGIHKPQFQVYAADLCCPDCAGKSLDEADLSAFTESALLDYSLDTTPDELLDLPLHALGIPALHVLEFTGEADKSVFLELTGDLAAALPGYAAKHAAN